MSVMKKNMIIRSAIVLAVLSSITLTSCIRGKYKDLPFGGMNGRVQKVTTWILMPEMWYAGNRGSDIMAITVSIYDIYGNEICSAEMDSAERVLSEAESLFEDGVCVRSSLKTGNRTIAQSSLISNKKGILEYSKEMNGRRVRMSVKQNSFGRRHKSVVSEDGKVTTISVIKTDRHGYPIKIITKEPQTGKKTVETNIFDKKHNVKEKHIYTNMGEDGKDEENIIYTDYGEADDHGNWTSARTYDKFHLPAQVLVREFEYWE